MDPLAALSTRAAYLLALALAPAFVSPAPTLSPTLISGLVSVLVLGALAVAGMRLRTRLGALQGLAASALLSLAITLSFVGAELFRGAGGPIGRGALYVAVPLWLGLAVIAYAVVQRHSSSASHPSAVLAPVVVAALFVGLYAPSARWLFSRDAMWMRALLSDGDDLAAVDALTRAPLDARRYGVATAILDRCLLANPNACACLARRAQIAVHTAAPLAVVANARDAKERCPGSLVARGALAEALALYGDAGEAEREARAGLEQADDGLLHYAFALALDRAGHHAEALEEAKHAVRVGGAGRDGAILLGSLAIAANDLDTAKAALDPLVATDPNDADAQYDLALVADRRDSYNRARQGYLAALQANPELASARYNLTLLTLRHGAVDEARHHAERFVAAFPTDPRGLALAQTVAMAGKK